VEADVKRSCGSGSSQTTGGADVREIDVEEDEFEEIRLGGVGH
jgi:hypothetical protein